MQSTLERPRAGVEHEHHEGQRTFDPLASVRMLRYDLERFGQVLPETRERVFDEELSYLAEGVDKAARTSFPLTRSENGEIMYFTRGEWRPYMGMLLTGQATAHAEAKADPRRKFLAEKSDDDLLRGWQMQQLVPGQSLKWYSPYPQDAADLYGKEFIQKVGFSPHRQMGFLYRAECQTDGSIILESQTVDRSDDEAFVAAMSGSNMDEMVTAYDGVLMDREPDSYFYAGRKGSEWDENAWEQIREQRDLAGYLLDGLERIAGSGAEGKQLEEKAKRHVYGVWAAFKKRLDGETPVYAYTGYDLLTSRQMLALEVQGAFWEFAMLGKTLIGCGGSINVLQGEENIMNADPSDVFKAIFGGSSEESGGPRDKYGPLNFKCPKGHWNKRPRAKSPKDFLPNCKHCNISLKC